MKFGLITKCSTIPASMIALLLCVSWPGNSAALDSSEESAEQQQLVDQATSTFERFLAEPGLAAGYRLKPDSMKAVFIVPKLWRGAVVVGGSGGRGVLLARDLVKGGWSPPAFYTMSSTSFGPQVGVDSSELILIVQTFAALERFSGKGTARLGVDGGFTVGAFGEGGTTALDVISFAWSKGAFMGFALQGFAITASSKDNRIYYGTPVNPEEILANKTVTNPGADSLRATLGRLIP
ncbi:MAG: lipid-binding SYLF domain-containing protein [Nitrospira sp.]|nr:lipid-binding SYLF domain-containing protein [Nitrospira sp.]